MDPFSRLMMATKGESLLIIIKIPLIYFINYLITTLAPRMKYPALAIIPAAVAFGIVTVAHRLLTALVILPYIYHEESPHNLIFNLQRIISAFLDLLFVVGFAVSLKQYRLAQKSAETAKNLSKEKLEAELKFLRTQTNPHFLFNTLNNIYALARKKSDDTADVVMKLSKLLRFMLYESRSNHITIVQELRVLSDYIELEKIRYNDRLSVRFIQSIDNEQQPIAPLILLPFVENAFKHGASEARFNSFITIDVKLVNGLLKFSIENSKDDDGQLDIHENIGLSNVRRQLQLMYPDHQLVINNDKEVFRVLLTINLPNYATVSMPHR